MSARTAPALACAMYSSSIWPRPWVPTASRCCATTSSIWKRGRGGWTHPRWPTRPCEPQWRQPGPTACPCSPAGSPSGGRWPPKPRAAEPLPGVRGLAFFGSPLHPPGKPDTARADHLDQVRIPSLFLQGTRDEFAQLDLLQRVVQRLGARATLHLIAGGDHSFKMKKSSGKTEQDVLQDLAGAKRAWADAL